MADTLAEILARLKADVPALADVPDGVLAAELQRSAQAGAGPSVGDALGPPVFRTSNEKDPSGAAVVRADAVSPWTKAATIGASPEDVQRSALRVALGELQPPARTPGLRAAGWGERAADAEHAAWTWLSRTLPGTVGDALGVTPFRAKAEELEHPPAIAVGMLPPPDVGLGTVGDEVGAGRGLYSRVDDAVSRLPAKGAHPNKIASLLKSNGATAEELAYRQVPEFLASQGNAPVTPGALQAHLDAHPAPLPVVKTRGGGASAFRVVPTSEVATPAGLDFPPYAVVNAEGTPLSFHQTAQAAQEGIAELPAMGIHGSGPDTKFAQYQLPGGAAYQETLLTLPESGGLPAGWRTGPSSTDPGQIGVFNPAGDQVTRAATAEDAIAQAQRYSTQSGRFRSSHFNEPNILVHTRSNTRTLPTGEPGRFLEEVQSDWHQTGKDKGYRAADPEAIKRDLTRRHEGLRAQLDALGEGNSPQHEAIRAQIGTLTDEWNAFHDKGQYGVPDAPFKETWPDLGLKQQLLEAAKDPEAQWLGFTSGETQAARYDLSKQIDELHYQPQQQRLLAFTKNGDKAIDEIVTPDKLANYIGKEGAAKLTAQPFDKEYPQSHVLRGTALQVGGEGMHHFYDELLPKRLQKIVKPFGGTVERTAIPAGVGENVHGTRGLGEAFFDAAHPDSLINGKLPVGSSRRLFSREDLGEAFVSGRLNAFDMPNYLQDAVQRTGGVKEPAWIVRLTPAMKARILKEGLPLGLLLGAAGPSVADALRSTSDHQPE